MQGRGRTATVDNGVRDGKRQSIFRSYICPVMERPNLTVQTDASVRRVIINRNRATGVEVAFRGQSGSSSRPPRWCSLGRDPHAQGPHVVRLDRPLN